jgi:hypothetical protein
MSARAALIAGALGLAACTPTPPQSSAPAPLVRADLASGAAVGAGGEARIGVRAVTRSGADLTPTVADCVAEGQGFSAAFAAPAELAVPTFGAASAPVTVRCATGGLSGAVLTQPVAQRQNGLAGWPAVGVGLSTGGGSYVSVGGFWNGGWGSGPQAYAVRYSDVEVVLD